MVFLGLLFVPMLIALGFLIFGGHRVTGKEFCVHMLVQCLVAGGSVGICYMQSTGDLEVWNGSVLKKEKERTSCSHSYECRCRTEKSCSGSGKKRSCTSSRVCDTCYDHSWDYDWVLTTSNSERIYIDRVNRQGTSMPPRFRKAKKGDPTAMTHSYTNYVKASSGTLFKRQGLEEQYKDKLPKYPSKVYDYHYLDRVIGFPNLKVWNQKLQKVNARLGKAKQVNVVLVGTQSVNPEWGEALEQKWLGGKKNDVVIVLGLDEGKPTWAHIMAWTDQEIFKVTLRDKLLDLPKFEPEAAMGVIESTVTELYVRKPMADFEYLRAGVTPSATQWVVSMLIGISLSIGLGVFFLKQEVV